MAMTRARWRWTLLAMASLFCTGCGVERTMTITSDPPGAMVTLNDQEIGRTPLTHDFFWYGTYDVELRKDGYRTLKTTGKVWAPWWQVPPIDLVAELLPVRTYDHHYLQYTLVPQPTSEPNPLGMLVRAERLRSQLQGSQSGRPATRPSVQPHPTTRPKKSH